MKAKTFIVFSPICVLSLIYSCSNEQINDEPAINGPVEITVESTGINARQKDLSDSDASIVAQLFCSRENPERSRASLDIKNVVTIYDEIGQPAIYAVNFQNGYILVSATKSYYPILAKVDHGTYSLNKEPSGEDVVIQDMLVNIKAARDSVLDFRCSGEWLQYEKSERPERPTSLSRAAYDDYWDAFNEWYDDVTDDYNCKVYKLYNCNEMHTDENLIPDDVYERFCNLASDEDLWEGTDYNWKNTAYIVARFNPGYQSYGSFVKTEWDQSGNYNNTSYQALGCVTIAVGQLMKYYQHPTSFKWSDMPNYYATTTLQNFLAQLRNELKVNSNGGASIEDAQRVLASYGYNCTTQSHNTVTINNSLKQQYPVYARGHDANRNAGHAWVIDGVETNNSYTEYILFRLSSLTYPDYEYIMAEGDNPWNDSTLPYNKYHMNWGWGGAYNGWYLDNAIAVSENPIRNYSTKRKEIIINSYN